MKINEGFELRTVCDENVIVAYGRKNIDFSKVISLNESAAYMWRAVEGKEFTCQELADLLCKEYEVDVQTAFKDASQMVASWKELGLVSD
ncbi:MAG: PqqD family protein [Bacteroidaceae bacterium]|nr:PqqD family protein [Bacteroidaceae bacterium]